jgi:hypothetical protein
LLANVRDHEENAQQTGADGVEQMKQWTVLDKTKNFLSEVRPDSVAKFVHCSWLVSGSGRQ